MKKILSFTFIASITIILIYLNNHKKMLASNNQTKSSDPVKLKKIERVKEV